MARGKEEGRREAKQEGKLEVKREILFKLIEQKFGDVSEADKQKIEETQDPDKLDQCLVLILESESIQEILKPLDG
jgi:predicted transposase YdaD